jgi:predicted GIY-YIG superfamily endonuclease
MYYVYILASRRHGTLYIGITNSLQKRLEEHRSGKGSEFVKKYGVYGLPTPKPMNGQKMRLPAKNSSSAGNEIGRSS